MRVHGVDARETKLEMEKSGLEWRESKVEWVDLREDGMGVGEDWVFGFGFGWRVNLVL